MNKKLIALILLALQGSMFAAETVVYADNSDACCVTRRPACCSRRSRRVSCCRPRSYNRGRRSRSCCTRRSRRARWNNCCTTRSRRWNNCCAPRRRPACCPRRRFCRPKPACCPANGTVVAEERVLEPEIVVEDVAETVEVAV